MPKKPRKERLDLLVQKIGGYEDPRLARGLIMAGKVVVDGTVVNTPGMLFPPSANIHLRETPLRFASRGGYKLERALQRFDIDVRERVCLDAGASTGGFTDCLLQRGAARVYAVEVGYGQLRGKLATDPRVVSFERTNISDLSPADLNPPIALACADLSYLSLRKAVPIIGALFIKQPHMVLLIKPLYEGLAQTEIDDKAALARVLRALFRDLESQGWRASNACVSPILGSRGAVEFLVEFGGPTEKDAESISDLALRDLEQSPPDEAAS
jgi:23S rRNA (cytidine1920-2'-O)/16S rRNA (cytidine1409-2'-O)-methyltransferase